MSKVDFKQYTPSARILRGALAKRFSMDYQLSLASNTCGFLEGFYGPELPKFILACAAWRVSGVDDYWDVIEGKTFDESEVEQLEAFCTAAGLIAKRLPKHYQENDFYDKSRFVMYCPDNANMVERFGAEGEPIPIQSNQ